MNKASVKGDVEAMRRLLDGGADINMDVGPGLPPLIIAVQQGHEALLQFLLERGANVNATAKNLGTTALMYAVECGHTELLPHLLAREADVNHQSRTGETALMLACTGGDPDIVRLLLNHGADHTIVSNANVTAQSYADYAGHKLNISAMAAEAEGVRAAAQETLRQQMIADMGQSCHAGVTDKVRISRPFQLKKPGDK
jgi:ankyrin repeat domain-containing protein 17